MIEEIDRNKINVTLSNWRNTAAAAALPSFNTMSYTNNPSITWSITSLNETDVLINKLNEIIRAVNELESKISKA